MMYKILILLGFIFSSLALSSDAYLKYVEFDVIVRQSLTLDGVCLPNQVCLNKGGHLLFNPSPEPVPYRKNRVALWGCCPGVTRIEFSVTMVRKVARMEVKLSPLEARVIGCLIEKEISTPDQYPLSLNALVNACNQKSNRDPVLALSEREVQSVVELLMARKLVSNVAGFNARVARYQHRFCNTEFGELKFSPAELAVLDELLLRGPQTPGELRSRCARLFAFTEVSEVDEVLTQLSQKGPYVQRLEREPGKRESRYAQLFTPLPEAVAPAQLLFGNDRLVNDQQANDRLAELEAENAALRQEVAQLRAELAQLRG